MFRSADRGPNNSGDVGDFFLNFFLIMFLFSLLTLFLPVLIYVYIDPKNSRDTTPVFTALSFFGNCVSVPGLFVLELITSEQYLQQSILAHLLGYIYIISVILAILGVIISLRNNIESKEPTKNDQKQATTETVEEEPAKTVEEPVKTVEEEPAKTVEEPVKTVEEEPAKTVEETVKTVEEEPAKTVGEPVRAMEKRRSDSPKYESNIRQSKDPNDGTINDERISRHVIRFEMRFDDGYYSIEGSSYESEEQAIDAFQNLMQDFGNRRKVMNIMRRYGIEKSTRSQDADFRDPQNHRL